MNEKNAKVKILVCTHKKWDIPNDSIYLPLHVGKDLSDLNLEYQGDNVGDNISYKNKNFCELTGLYWGWKNLDVDYIGLSHYRRYLDFGNDSPIEFIKGYDVILPKLNVLSMSAANQLMNLTTREDFHIMLMSVLKLYPEYKQTLLDCFYNSNKCSLFNMLFCKKNIYDDYCNWLFSIFEEMEKWVKLSSYSRLSRLYGFIGEYLLYVYCRHNNLHVKFTDVVSYPGRKENTIRKDISKYASKCVKNISFRLFYPKKKAFPINPTNTTGFVCDGIPYIDENGNINN